MFPLAGKEYVHNSFHNYFYVQLNFFHDIWIDYVQIEKLAISPQIFGYS